MTAEELLTSLSDVLGACGPAERLSFVRRLASLLAILDDTENALIGTNIPTGRVAQCENCEEPIAEVRDPKSGALHWYSNGGDYECEGDGSHKPFDASEWMASTSDDGGDLNNVETEESVLLRIREIEARIAEKLGLRGSPEEIHALIVSRSCNNEYPFDVETNLAHEWYSAYAASTDWLDAVRDQATKAKE